MLIVMRCELYSNCTTLSVLHFCLQSTWSLTWGDFTDYSADFPCCGMCNFKESVLHLCLIFHSCVHCPLVLTRIMTICFYLSSRPFCENGWKHLWTQNAYILKNQQYMDETKLVTNLSNNGSFFDHVWNNHLVSEWIKLWTLFTQRPWINKCPGTSLLT